MSVDENERLGRRDALLGIAATISTVAVAGASVGVGLGSARADDRAEAEASSPPPAQPDPLHGLRQPDEAVRALFGDLRGRVIEGHWRVEAVHAVRAGAIPVVLSIRTGARFAAEVFRWDASDPEPIGRAEGLALYLVNGGDGQTATDEMAGLGVRALGRALDARLAEGASIPQGLSTLGERSREHPGGAFHVPT
ncbi:MAG: hypothetical protein RLO52_21570 [Sandaracinaceae bacterium]